MKPISKLGIGPMSPEIIEAVFKYSEQNETPLMLIASQNQIDWDHGYVNHWNTLEYTKYLNNLKIQYPKNQVYICRDHCGPNFKHKNIKDVYKTIDNDLENNFDLIHIDFCKYQGTYEKILKESKKAIEYIYNKSPKTLIEIGTDENTGTHLNNTSKIEKEMYFFSQIAPIQFFVCQTGSLIKEINQIGNFNTKFIKKIKKIAKKYNLYLKEHNADYCDPTEIKLRNNIVDSVNVAPQYGVIQTQLTIQKCLTYGINFDEFLKASYNSKKWDKWMHKNTNKNKLLCAIIAGHYNFTDDTYKKIYNQINQYEDFKDNIINEIMKNIDLYIKYL